MVPPETPYHSKLASRPANAERSRLSMMALIFGSVPSTVAIKPGGCEAALTGSAHSLSPISDIVRSVAVKIAIAEPPTMQRDRECWQRQREDLLRDFETSSAFR